MKIHNAEAIRRARLWADQAEAAMRLAMEPLKVEDLIANLSSLLPPQITQPALPMSLLQTTDLDGQSRLHLQVSAPPEQSLRFELPRGFYLRLEQEQREKFVLVLVPRGSPESPPHETQKGHAGSSRE